MVNDLIYFGMSEGMIHMRDQSFVFLIAMYKAKMRRIQTYLEPLKKTGLLKGNKSKIQSFSAPPLPEHLRRNKKR